MNREAHSMAGVTVGLDTAARYSQDEPHRGVKAFLEEHRALFGYGPEVPEAARIGRDCVAPQAA